jgi:hypothetical protein
MGAGALPLWLVHWPQRRAELSVRRAAIASQGTRKTQNRASPFSDWFHLHRTTTGRFDIDNSLARGCLGARQDIRVVLTSGSNDMDNTMGNWALANHTMADALRFAGYDYRYDFGNGGHNSQHGGAMFAEHLRWLFRPRETPTTGAKL